MKCEDFKFEYTVAPNETSVESNEHLASCQQCQLFVEQEKQLEQKLNGVINVEVSSELRYSLRESIRTKAAFLVFP